MHLLFISGLQPRARRPEGVVVDGVYRYIHRSEPERIKCVTLIAAMENTCGRGRGRQGRQVGPEDLSPAFPREPRGGGTDRPGQFTSAQLQVDVLKHAWSHILAHDGQTRESGNELGERENQGTARTRYGQADKWV
ncbi:unnamed protein product [Boreogadus saida]